MAKTDEEILDDLATRMDTLCEHDDGDGLLDGLQQWQGEVLEVIYMVEARQRGENLTLAKLSYDRGEMKQVGTAERIDRLAGAMAFLSDWQSRRAVV